MMDRRAYWQCVRVRIANCCASRSWWTRSRKPPDLSRLIVVSNRVAPITEGEPTAGGLAAGVLDALKQQGGIWFGWGGEVSHDTAAPAHWKGLLARSLSTRSICRDATTTASIVALPTGHF